MITIQLQLLRRIYAVNRRPLYRPTVNVTVPFLNGMCRYPQQFQSLLLQTPPEPLQPSPHPPSAVQSKLIIASLNRALPTSGETQRQSAPEWFRTFSGDIRSASSLLAAVGGRHRFQPLPRPSRSPPSRPRPLTARIPLTFVLRPRARPAKSLQPLRMPAQSVTPEKRAKTETN